MSNSKKQSIDIKSSSDFIKDFKEKELIRSINFEGDLMVSEKELIILLETYTEHIKDELRDSEHTLAIMEGELEKDEKHVEELKWLLKNSRCPNRLCVDGIIENPLKKCVELCKWCDMRKKLLK